jgi:hypothetical protein
LISETIASKRTTTTKPAADTTAAVNCPDMAATAVIPASTRQTTSIKTAPRGVLIMLMIVLDVDPFGMFILALPKPYLEATSKASV